MYPKIKKYRQQDLFDDNKFLMPEKGRYFYCASVLMLANWGRIYGVKNVSLRSKDDGKTFKVFVEFCNGRRWHTRRIPNRQANDTAMALYRYLSLLSKSEIWYSTPFGYAFYMKSMQTRFRRLLKLLKKCDIH